MNDGPIFLIINFWFINEKRKRTSCQQFLSLLLDETADEETAVPVQPPEVTHTRPEVTHTRPEVTHTMPEVAHTTPDIKQVGLRISREV